MILLVSIYPLKIYVSVLFICKPKMFAPRSIAPFIHFVVGFLSFQKLGIYDTVFLHLIQAIIPYINSKTVMLGSEYVRVLGQT